jgi:hypothetical protein
MLTPKVGWVCRHNGRRATIVHVGPTTLIDGEIAHQLVILTAPDSTDIRPHVLDTSTAEVDATPAARPAAVLTPVARWLSRPRIHTADVAAIEDATLAVLGHPWHGAA